MIPDILTKIAELPSGEGLYLLNRPPIGNGIIRESGLTTDDLKTLASPAVPSEAVEPKKEFEQYATDFLEPESGNSRFSFDEMLECVDGYFDMRQGKL